MPFRRPSARRSSRKKSERPGEPGPSGRARVSATSLVTADVNHFVPKSRHAPAASRRASVSVPLTSLPPERSVIHWPLVHRRSGSRLVSLGTTRAASSPRPCSRIVRAAPSVIARWQV